MKKVLALLFIPLIAGLSYGQVKTPAASTHASSETTVGMTTIKLDYSRPNKKDRVIFGDLVPYGKIWRTGANANTTIEFSDDVIVGGQEIKAGKYSIFSKPEQDSWIVYFNPKTDNWGSVTEDALKDAYMTRARVEKLPYTAETFTISIDELTLDDAVLRFAWDTTKVDLKVQVPTEKKTMASIDATMASGKAESRDYLAAANYYFSSGKDIQKAKEWMDKGTSMMKEVPYYTEYQKALIYQKAGDKAGALTVANKALESAIKAESPEYIKYAQDLIGQLVK